MKIYRVKSKSKWNSELKKVATGGDGNQPRAPEHNQDLNHFGDPVDTHAKLGKSWRGIWQDNKTRGEGWGELMTTLNTMPDFPDRRNGHGRQ